MSLYPTSWTYILILSSHLILCLPSGPFPTCPPPLNPVYISPLCHTWHIHSQSLSSLFDHPTNNIWWGVILGSSWYIYLDSLVTSSLLGTNILKAPQVNLLLQCEISTLFSFVVFSLCLQKSNNFVTLLLPFLLAFIPWILNFNSDGPETLSTFHIWWCYRAQQLSWSAVIRWETCWMFLQPYVLNYLNIVFYFMCTFISIKRRNFHQPIGVLTVYLFIFVMLYLSSKSV